MTVYNQSASGGPAIYGPRNIPEHYAVTVRKTQSTTETKDFIVKAYSPQTWTFDQSSTYEPIVGGSLTSGLIGNVMAAFGVSAVFQPLTAKVWRGTSDSPITLTLEFQSETDAYHDVVLPAYYMASLCSPTVAKDGVSGTLGMLQSPAAHLDTSVFSGAYDAFKSMVTDATKSLISDNKPPIQNVTTSDPSSTKAICGPDYTMPGGSNKTASNTPAFGTIGWFKKYLKNIVQLSIGKRFNFDMIIPISFQQNIAMQPDANGWPSYIQATFVFQPLFMITLDDLGNIFGIDQKDRVNAPPPAGTNKTTQLPSLTGIVGGAAGGITGGAGGGLINTGGILPTAMPLPSAIVPDPTLTFKLPS